MTHIKIFVMTVLCAFFNFELSYAQNKTSTKIKISLDEAESLALANAIEFDLQSTKISAANDAIEANKARTMPQLSLEGNYRYQSEAASTDIGPMHLQFGQHNNFSVGPVVSYTVFNGGVDAKTEKSLEELARARVLEREGIKQKVLLDVRQAYARVQTNRMELVLIDRSIALAKARTKDLQRKFNAGSSTKLDVLSGEREESQLLLRRAQTQNTLEEAIRKLEVYIGKKNIDPHQEFDVDDMQTTLAQFKNSPKSFDENHPNIQAATAMIRAAKLNSESVSQLYLPHVQAYAKSTIDYPNGPIDERVWQNTIGVNVSVPIYDFGLRNATMSQKLAEVKTAELQKSLVERDFDELFLTTTDKIRSLKSQIEITNSAIDINENQSHLIEVNFKNGASTYLEVERAHNQVLEARTTLFRLKAMLIIQYSILSYLSENHQNQMSEMSK